MPRDRDRAVEQVHCLFIQVARRLRRRHPVPGELTLLQVLVLRELAAAADSLRPSDLADRLAVTPGTVTPLVDRLIRAGLVERRRDPADRRVLRLSLTPQGGSRLRQVEETHRRLWDRALSGLDHDQLQALAALLGRIVVTLDSSPDSDLPVGSGGPQPTPDLRR
ncbi:MAG TPA: MarR family transcriptional regulator [Bacillota bacterium]